MGTKLSQSGTQMSGSFERKILQIIFGPVQVKGTWRIRHSEELYTLYKYTDLVTYKHVTRLK
jgi:hypothetical protein